MSLSSFMNKSKLDNRCVCLRPFFQFTIEMAFFYFSVAKNWFMSSAIYDFCFNLSISRALFDFYIFLSTPSLWLIAADFLVVEPTSFLVLLLQDFEPTSLENSSFLVHLFFYDWFQYKNLIKTGLLCTDCNYELIMKILIQKVICNIHWYDDIFQYSKVNRHLCNLLFVCELQHLSDK